MFSFNNASLKAGMRRPTSLRQMAAVKGIAVPISLRQVIAAHTLVYTAPIVTGGLAALGGWVLVTINLDGSVRWQGHVHNSGIDGYDFSVAVAIRTPSGQSFGLARKGRVGNEITSGSRNYDWDETLPPSALISKFLSDYTDGHIELHREYKSDIGSIVKDVFEEAVKWLAQEGVKLLSSL